MTEIEIICKNKIVSEVVGLSEEDQAKLNGKNVKEVVSIMRAMGYEVKRTERSKDEITLAILFVALAT